MKKLLLGACAALVSLSLSAQQTYKELAEQAFHCVEQDSLDRAAGLFRQALKLEPGNAFNAELFAGLGEICYRQKRPQEAIEQYTLSLNMRPKSVPTLLSRAGVYLETGDERHAYTDYCDVLDLDKDNREALFFRAYINMSRRDYKAARVDYERLLMLDANHFNARLGLAVLNQKEGRLKEWYGCFEANPYQQGWFVPHDVPGMVELMGGREKVLADLKQFFDQTPPDFLWNLYYNHANEPVHFVPFLFNRLGEPWLTQKWTRVICRKAYFNKVEGIVGNEDVGQMSAWYVLAASGLHPDCPGDTRMQITSPVFDRVEFRLDPAYYPGKTFTVVAHGNSPKNVYIQKAVLNGKPYRKCHLDFSEVTAGGTLELYMGSEPNEQWGVE